MRFIRKLNLALLLGHPLQVHSLMPLPITTLPPVSITSVHYPSVPPLPPSVHPYTSTQPYAVTYFQSTGSRISLFPFSFASLCRSIRRMHFILYSFQFLVSTYLSAVSFALQPTAFPCHQYTHTPSYVSNKKCF